MNINFPEADVFGNIVTMGLASRRHIGKKTQPVQLGTARKIPKHFDASLNASCSMSATALVHGNFAVF